MRTLRSAFCFTALALAALAAQAQSPYRLSDIEKQPIPRDEFYRLWRNVALGNCDKAFQQRNQMPATCRQQVIERAPACAAGLADKTPEKVGSVELSTGLARQYLACAMAGTATGTGAP
jgi:hypothetical protein